MKYAICNEVYGDWPIEKAFAHAKAAGYDGIEIAPFTLAEDVFRIDQETRHKVIDIAQRNGLEIVGLHWLLAGTDGFHLTSADKGVRDRTVDYLLELVKLCDELGGKVMVFGSPNERNLSGDVSVEMGERYAVEILEQLVPSLESNDVVLALEPLGPEETNFMNTAESAIRIIEAIGSEKIKLHLDVKAMSTEPTSIPDIIVSSEKHLEHFHANDPNRQGPGMGTIQFEPIIRALKKVGYDGWLSVEVFDYEPGIEKLVCGSFDYLKTVVTNESANDKD